MQVISLEESLRYQGNCGAAEEVEGLRKLAAEASAKLKAANWSGVAGGTWWRRDDVADLVKRLDTASGPQSGRVG